MEMDVRRNGRAVDEQSSARILQQVIAASRKDFSHRVVVGRNGKDHIRFSRYFRQILRRRTTKFRSEIRYRFPIGIVNRGDVKLSILQSARHVRAHSTNSDKPDVHKNEMTNVECRSTKE